MNAFKKELAGMLLDSDESFEAMEQIVSSMDEVFTNLAKQIDYKDTFSVWISFMAGIAYNLGEKIRETCLNEDMEVYEGAKPLIDAMILLEKITDTEYDNMVFDDINEKYKMYYFDRKKELLK